jgi:hypothetical protein
MPTSPIPSRSDLHKGLLWFARWRFGNGEQYAGPIVVTISAKKKKSEKVIVESEDKADGMVFPVALVVVPSAPVNGLELLRVLLSEDERNILRAVVDHPGALVKVIQEASKIQSAKFYALWGNLRSRELVAESEHGDGFVLAVDWLAPLLVEPNHPASVRLATNGGQ